MTTAAAAETDFTLAASAGTTTAAAVNGGGIRFLGRFGSRSTTRTATVTTASTLAFVIVVAVFGRERIGTVRVKRQGKGDCLVASGSRCHGSRYQWLLEEHFGKHVVRQVVCVLGNECHGIKHVVHHFVDLTQVQYLIPKVGCRSANA